MQKDISRMGGVVISTSGHFFQLKKKILFLQNRLYLRQFRVFKITLRFLLKTGPLLVQSKHYSFTTMFILIEIGVLVLSV